VRPHEFVGDVLVEFENGIDVAAGFDHRPALGICQDRAALVGGRPPVRHDPDGEMVAEPARLAQVVDVAVVEQVRHHGDEHPHRPILLILHGHTPMSR
jgi:hypothetical protein